VHRVRGDLSVVVDCGLGSPSTGSISVAMAEGRHRNPLVATTAAATASSGAAGTGVRGAAAAAATSASATKAIHDVGRGL